MAKGLQLPLGSLSWLTVLNLFGAVVGLIQTIVIAWIFGATRSIEIFFAATTFQAFLLKIATTGQVSDLFTPIFHDIQVKHDQERARNAFSAMVNAMLIAAGVVTVLACLFAGPIAKLLVPGFESAEIELCGTIFLVTAPLLLLQIAGGLFGNFLAAEHFYGVEEVLGVVCRVGNLLIVLMFGWTLGVWALILALWAAAVIRLVGQFVFVTSKGYRHQLVLQTEDFSPRTVLFKMPFAYVHVFSAQFFAFAITAALSFLPEGNYAAFSYAKRLHSKFNGIVLRPIGVLFFNRFSQSLAEGAEQVRGLATHALSLSVAVVTLVSVPIVAGGDFLLAGLWGGEKFPRQFIELSYIALVVFTVSLLLDAQYLVARRTNLALKIVVRQFVASGFVMLLAGLACYLVIPNFGVPGALWICCLSVVLQAASTIFILSWERKDLVAVIPASALMQWFVAAAGSLIVVFLLRSFFHFSVEPTRLQELLMATVFGGISVVLVGGFAWVLKIEEARQVVAKIRSTLVRVS